MDRLPNARLQTTECLLRVRARTPNSAHHQESSHSERTLPCHRRVIPCHMEYPSLRVCLLPSRRPGVGTVSDTKIGDGHIGCRTEGKTWCPEAVRRPVSVASVPCDCGGGADQGWAGCLSSRVRATSFSRQSRRLSDAQTHLNGAKASHLTRCAAELDLGRRHFIGTLSMSSRLQGSWPTRLP